MSPGNLDLGTTLGTCMHICILTAVYTVKPVLSGHLKEDQFVLNAGQKYCRMLQGEHSAILLTFISYHLLFPPPPPPPWKITKIKGFAGGPMLAGK